ncbi:MAG: STAS domain-containing protein [Ignavibacteriaceae bacterium]|nr:STAS domain-containing protein [Ignavibacteriaceae bacterium]MCW8960584.1 STAS domain-containing protein [Ignavibacteriaceae bacterium]MCW9095789.1 STAS domain-containing protein [Ignavibacteriaceae bacterium]
MDDFKINVIDDIAVVKIDILIATHRDAKPLWDELESRLIFKWNKLIIDLSPCNYIDSTFIGMIVKIFRKISEKNGQMVLVLPKLNTIESFNVLGITKIMPSYNSLEEALIGLGSQPKNQNFEFDKKFSVN